MGTRSNILAPRKKSNKITILKHLHTMIWRIFTMRKAGLQPVDKAGEVYAARAPQPNRMGRRSVQFRPPAPEFVFSSPSLIRPARIEFERSKLASLAKKAEFQSGGSNRFGTRIRNRQTTEPSVGYC